MTSGGKNVAPSVIEDRIAAHPLVGQAFVVGDGQKYVAALITIDADYFGYWKTTAGKDEHATVADLADDADLTRGGPAGRRRRATSRCRRRSRCASSGSSTPSSTRRTAT